MADCWFWQVQCQAEDTANKVAENIVVIWGRSTLEALDKALAKVGTFWVDTPTPDVSSAESATTYVADSTAWVAGVVLAGSLMVAAVYLMWSMRGEEVRKVVAGVLRMIMFTGVGTVASQLLINISDGLSTWFLEQAVDDMNGSFATKLLTIAEVVPSEAGWLLIILGGVIGIVANLIQMGLMYVRDAMLVLVVGIVPLAAAAAITDWGRAWLSKLVGWVVAFATMKPTAAIIYGVAIKLVTSETLTATDSLGAFVRGVILMVMAALALPALVRFLVPVAGAVASGGGAGALTAGAGVLATGAVIISRSGGKGSGGRPGGGPPADQSAPPGSDGGRGPAGAAGRDGAAGPTGSPGGAGRAAAGSGAAAGGSAAGAAGGGAAASGSASGAAAGAGAAAGPVGAVVMVGAQAAAAGTRTASAAADSAAGESAPGAGQVAR